MTNNRKQWNSNLSFLLAIIGAAVGLGNIWRFPYVFYSNGQGAFLIPYLCAIVILGLPFMLLENSIGVKFNDSVLNTFKKLGDKYQIIAWAIMLVSFFIVTYYICIVGWDLNYFLFSFTKSWGSNPDIFFNNDFLHSTNSINGIFTIVPYIFIATAIIWFLTWLISSKDISGISKFSSIFVPLLFILGIGIACYNLMLPGAYIGFIRFFTPNWSLLLDFHIWLAAFGQILFTLSLGCGVVLSYSSHLPRKTNITHNSLIVICANCGFELFNAIGVFSILGYMSYSTGASFDSLITEGSGLAFVAFPQVFNILGDAGIYLGALFFFSILIAGLTTSISFIEPLTDSLSDTFNLTRLKSVSIVAISGFIISIIFTTCCGDYLIKIFDSCLNNFLLVLLVVLQCIIFAWIYHIKDLIQILNENTIFKVGNWWKNIVKYILPCLLTTIWIIGVINLIQSSTILDLIIYTLIISIIFIISTSLYILSKKKGVLHYEKSMEQ